MADPLEPLPLIEGAQSAESLTGSLLRPIERKAGRVWWALFFLTLGGTGVFGLAIAVTLVKGIGAWGNNLPVAWAFGEAVHPLTNSAIKIRTWARPSHRLIPEGSAKGAR